GAGRRGSAPRIAASRAGTRTPPRSAVAGGRRHASGRRSGPRESRGRTPSTPRVARSSRLPSGLPADHRPDTRIVATQLLGSHTVQLAFCLLRYWVIDRAGPGSMRAARVATIDTQ